MKKWFLLSAVASATLIGSAGASSAQGYGQYSWCGQHQDKGGARICAYTSYAQCISDMVGIGGFCVENPAYTGGPRPAAPARRLRRHRYY
jgi:hypothetical protein